jgi:DNA polymerase III subunit chi
MTHVQFYHLPDSMGSLLPVLVELVEMALGKDIDILILTDNEDQSTPIHHYLEQRFQLGAELTLAPQPQSRFSLSWGEDPAHHHGLLINLTPQLPVWFSRFEHLAELIWGNETLVERKRDSYKLIRHRGHPLKFHDLTGNRQADLL